MNKAAEREAVAELIKRNFDQVALNDGITWREAEELDNRSSAEERIAARQLDLATSKWQHVDPQLFIDFPSAIYFLDAKGFCFYLPALMVWSLQEGIDSDSATPDNLLTLLGDSSRQRWFEGFTSERKGDIDAFVRLMMRQYWQETPSTIAKFAKWI